MTIPDKHRECEYAFYGRPIEVGHGWSTDPEFFKLPQEVESLVALTDYETGVELP